MDAAQDFGQVRYFPSQQHPLTWDEATDDAGPLQFPFGQPADVFDLLAQVLPEILIVGAGWWLVGQLGQGSQRCL